jgi:hypothetical protein
MRMQWRLALHEGARHMHKYAALIHIHFQIIYLLGYSHFYVELVCQLNLEVISPQKLLPSSPI